MIGPILAAVMVAASLLAQVNAHDSDVDTAVRLAYDHFDKFRTFEKNIIASRTVLRHHRPEAKQLAVAAPTLQISGKGFNGLLSVRASVYLSGYLSPGCLSNGDQACARIVSTYTLSNTTLGPACKAEHEAQCDSSAKYRSLDGSCNNLATPSQGKSGTAYSRVLFPDYYLGIYQTQPKGSRTKGALPSPRVVSNEISTPSGQEENDVSLALPAWAQFVANDIAFTTSLQMATERAAIICCDSYGGTLMPRYRHDFCEAIDIPSNDPVYSKSYKTCMHYVRSMPAFNDKCNFGPQEQLNQASHYLDGSMIYGSGSHEANILRIKYLGLLRTNPTTRTETLPLSNSKAAFSDECTGTCMLSGDKRVNENPQLTALHTIFLREHNRLARAIRRSNPTALDEVQYQEARRLLVAEIQHITYHEFVPVLLGEKLAQEINEGAYDPTVSAEVNNEVAVAVLRFFISLVQQEINLVDNDGQVKENLTLGEHFFNPHVVDEPNVLDSLLRGFATQSSQKLDFGVVPDLTSRYLANPGKLGLDVLSLDIQRGRDHGFPGYNEYRKHCGLPAATTFEDLRNNVSPENIDKLKAVYEKVDNIDLLVGGLAETRAHGILGETFSCLLAEQLKRTRRGDRFYYENNEQPYPLTCAQLGQVKSRSLAAIICENGDNVASIQPNVFKKPGPGNEIKPCSEILASQINAC